MALKFSLKESFLGLILIFVSVSDFPIQVGSLAVPHGASWVGVLVAGTLGLLGLRARAS